MGLDACLAMVRTPRPEVMDRLIEKFNADWAETREAWPANEMDVSHRYPQMEPSGQIWTLWRYYTPTYARGHWPQIRALIEWLQRNTEGDVLYGNDCDSDMETWELATPELLDRYQRFWDAHGNARYDDFEAWVWQTWRHRE